MNQTSQTLDEILEQFERMVRELVSLGYSADKAVQIAYKSYPIMEMLEAPLTADMVENFNKAYHSVLTPLSVAGHRPFNYTTQSISEAMQAAWASDGLKLSKRLHRNAHKVQRETAEVIKQSLKRGKSIREIARSIFEGYGNGGIIDTDKLPKHIERLRTLKPPQSLNDEELARFKRVIRRTERQVRQNTTPSLRAAYSELIQAVDEGNAIDLSRAVTVAVQEKARYNAERIARTETARAYADGQMLRYKDDDDVVALKWVLSSRHPRYDICDFYANADLYGLGKGVYPKDKFPTLPAHPHCMCRISPIFDFEVDIHQAKENIEEGGKRYSNSLSKVNQEHIIGVHGMSAVSSGKESWTERARGWSGDIFEVRRPKSLYEAFSDIDSLIIDDDKITKYCLNKEHKQGGPKAVAFEKYLGYNLSRAKEFEQFLRKSVIDSKITEKGVNKHGTRYELTKYVDSLKGGRIKLVMAWQIDTGSKIPRLISTYVKPEDKIK